MRRRTAHRSVVLTAVVALLASACVGTQGTKAGGDPQPVTLRMADPYADLTYEPPVGDFVKRVGNNSDGRIRVDVVHKWGNLKPDAERQVVEAVASGKADLAWVGTRALDTLGVHSFQALNAPLMIDSYALQKQVIASDVPRRMLKGLDKLDVTGLAVLAGGLRKPVTVKHPLLGPDDWRGLRIQTFPSRVQADAIQALGAEPVQVGPEGRTAGLKSGKIDGVEINLSTYAHNVMEPLASHITLNVTLWPETVVLLVNPARLAKLGDRGEDWIRAAAEQAAAHSADLVGPDDKWVAQRCGNGAQFARASATEVRALRDAVEPVYQRLDKDPQTKALLADIRRLKRSTSAEPVPAVPSSCPEKSATPAPDDQGATPARDLDGTYRWTLTKDDARKYGTGDEDLSHYPSTMTMTLRGGDWSMKSSSSPETDSGTYTVKGDRVVFDWPSTSSQLTFTCSADAHGSLRLSPVEPMDAGDRFVWSTRPWTKVG
ncbi:TRAP transporter substrate-binding protein [Streptomyces sp. NPDC006602]|uniref:TRAP transporter substrate-binding protein n=1 Tax=Streptomyces sp. NPDC006602 TaxID=3364751 RepID=UPI0036A67CCB